MGLGQVDKLEEISPLVYSTNGTLSEITGLPVQVNIKTNTYHYS